MRTSVKVTAHLLRKDSFAKMYLGAPKIKKRSNRGENAKRERVTKEAQFRIRGKKIFDPYIKHHYMVNI